MNADNAAYDRCLIVDVIDEGSGIAPEVMPRLFSAFTQEDKARSFGGLGLGLSICRAVVEMHGGTISAKSDGQGCGSTFTVRLPVTQSHQQSAPLPETSRPANGQAEPEKKQPVRILLVEEHADTAMLMRRLLTAQGHEVIVAGSVVDGLAAAQRTGPDLLISDLGLPDGSGLDLMQKLRDAGHHLPAIALSGYGTSADIENSKAAGFAEHLVKPLQSVGPLKAAIRRLGL